MMRYFIVLCLLLLLLPLEISAHSGRTDSYGGHNKTANGTYHCHSGKCLEDAWQEAFDYFYPIGRSDGLSENDQIGEITDNILNNLDSDQVEYMLPYALKAYKMGYDETYVPTFWESYWKYIIALVIILGIIMIYFLTKIPKAAYQEMWAFFRGLFIILLVISIFWFGRDLLLIVGNFTFNGLLRVGVNKDKADFITLIVTLIGIFLIISIPITVISYLSEKMKKVDQDIK